MAAILDRQYTTSGVADIYEALAAVDLTPHISEHGFIDAQVGAHIIRIAQEDGAFEVFLFSRGYVLQGKAMLDGALAQPVTLATLIESFKDVALGAEGRSS